MEIDLNADLGEGGPQDEELVPLITSANVACGFHAGGPQEAMRVLRLAARQGVRVGAHPSFPDRVHFGRQEMVRSEEDVYLDCVYQVGALAGLARAAGLSLTHLKPHGALYHQACREETYARPVVAAAALFGLAVVGLPESALRRQSAGRCRFLAEGFADRRYRPDGTLVPRTEPGALLQDPEEAVRQALWLIRERGVQTLCVHGDHPQALAFVRALRQALAQAGVSVRPFA
jgi:UPF0271 protein